MRVLDLTLTEARAGDHVVRRYGNPPDIQFEIALRLPRLHLPLVIERMQRHNRRRAPGTGGKSRLP